jgi:hypothetical protein
MCGGAARAKHPSIGRNRGTSTQRKGAEAATNRGFNRWRRGHAGAPKNSRGSWYTPWLPMSAYREGPGRPRAPSTPKPGLVSDMVRQFADPYAFLRELVQNSMDAGASRIEVTLTRDMNGSVKTSVSDDGAGMTLATIESSLLTLFSSSKEGQTDKIGKYGVGFISVLAVSPVWVLVETWSAGGAWRVRLDLDQQYAVEELPARSGSGTQVCLEHSMDSTGFDEHAAHCRESLARWCRHARTPIFLSVTDYGNPGASVRVKCDVPLAVHAAASVSDITDDATIVVGPSAGGAFLHAAPEVPGNETSAAFAGFYNRGLTLYETTAEHFKGLEGLRFKIESSKLQHTLSRDNVRRGRDFDRLIARTRDLARRSLPHAVETALVQAAESVAAGGDTSQYLALLSAAVVPPLSLGPKRVVFPLTDPVDAKSALSAAELERRTPWRKAILTSNDRNELTAELSASGRPVVLCPHPLIQRELAALIADGGTRSAEPAGSRHVVLSALAPSELSEHDRAFTAALEQLLGRAGRPVRGISLANAFGAFPSLLVLSTELSRGVVEVTRVQKASRRWGKQAELYLDTRHPAIVAARKRAKLGLHEVAQIVTRLILLERAGPISAKANDALLAAHSEHTK